MEVVVMSKVHARCFVVLLLSVFTCGILEWRVDTAEDLLREIPELISQLDTDPSQVGFDRAQYLLLIGTEYRSTIVLLLRHVESEMECAVGAHRTHVRGISLDRVHVLQQSLRAILDHLNRLLTVYSSRLNVNDNMNDTAYPTITAATPDIGLGQGFFEISSTRGLQRRPKLQISRQQIEMLEEFGYTYAQSASILGVTAQTLCNRRRELNMPVGVGCYTEMSDLALDEVVHDVLQISPEVGERLMIGSLRSRGLHIQRWRIRESILRVDPIGRACRRRRTIFRRQYSVSGPDALW